MKRKLIPIIIIIVVLAVAGGAAYRYFASNPEAWQQTLVSFGLEKNVAAEGQITASGFIEADQINLSSEVSGRIKTLVVDEGDFASAGQLLVRLDTSLLDAQTEQAEAQIALAEAQLAQLKAGVPPEQIAVAEAALALAKAQREAADQAWQDGILLRNTPQELNAQIDATYSEREIAQLQIEQAALIRDAVELRESIAADSWELTQRGLDFSFTVPGKGKKSVHVDFKEGEKQQASVEWNLATMKVWQAWVNLENAQAAQTSAQEKLNTLLAQRAEPLSANLQVARAEADYQAKVAAVSIAQANLDQLEAGPPASQISVLEAQRDQAQSQLVALAAQRENYALYSPIEGVVVTRAAHQGEVALPGNTLLTVANLNQVTLTVFVPESEYGRLRVNQAVAVSVDSYPGRTFHGTISYINDQAEFTPKNVQTQEERVSLVYAVKIRLSNPGDELKPGMPADVVFIEALTPEGVKS